VRELSELHQIPRHEIRKTLYAIRLWHQWCGTIRRAS
jgi:hypothetical protein